MAFIFLPRGSCDGGVGAMEPIKEPPREANAAELVEYLRAVIPGPRKGDRVTLRHNPTGNKNKYSTMPAVIVKPGHVFPGNKSIQDIASEDFQSMLQWTVVEDEHGHRYNTLAQHAENGDGYCFTSDFRIETQLWQRECSGQARVRQRTTRRLCVRLANAFWCFLTPGVINAVQAKGHTIQQLHTRYAHQKVF